MQVGQLKCRRGRRALQVRCECRTSVVPSARVKRVHWSSGASRVESTLQRNVSWRVGRRRLTLPFVSRLLAAGLSGSFHALPPFSFLSLQIVREDDNNWPEPDRVGLQELEVVLGKDHISFSCGKIGSLLDVQDSQDPEGLRLFYYLVQVRAVYIRTHAPPAPPAPPALLFLLGHAAFWALTRCMSQAALRSTRATARTEAGAEAGTAEARVLGFSVNSFCDKIKRMLLGRGDT